jgi:toxin ParE1/3/4
VKRFTYSSRAKSDLISIAEYTLREWGESQATKYIDQLEDCCQRLAQNPFLGRPCGPRLPGLRRLEQGRHVIFYRNLDAGIRISRILHQKMLPRQQSFGDKE